LISYYKAGNLSIINLLEVLEIKNYKEIQEFKILPTTYTANGGFHRKELN